MSAICLYTLVSSAKLISLEKSTSRDVQGFLNLYLMLMYDGLKDWCSSQYSKTLFFFVLGQILKIL